jgi:hypothetical protein
MKRSSITFILALATLLSFNAPLLRAQNATAQRVSPPRNWGVAFTRYSEFRVDYDAFPLRVVNTSGGKLGPTEKFKIEVSSLWNRSKKSINAAEFTWYLFDYSDLDKAVDSGKTSLVELSLLPDEERACHILVVQIEDIPFLKDKNPHGGFLLEVGVTKVVYSDGSTWEAAGTPGKFDHSKAPKSAQ